MEDHCDQKGAHQAVDNGGDNQAPDGVEEIVDYQTRTSTAHDHRAKFGENMPAFTSNKGWTVDELV